MTAPKFMLISVLGLCCGSAFAQDGAERLQKRQEVFALERPIAHEAITASQDHQQKINAAASTVDKKSKPRFADDKPAC